MNAPRLEIDLDKIEHNAKTDFYKNLAGASSLFVRHDANYVVEAVQAYAES